MSPPTDPRGSGAGGVAEHGSPGPARRLGGCHGVLAAERRAEAGFFQGGDDEAHENLLADLAHGNPLASRRTRRHGDGQRSTTLWIAQLLLLAAASGIFWHVSWRHWPQRVFALPEERPAMRRRLRLLATVRAGLAGATFVLGVIASR
ncbi:MAG: hypothetical protein ACR2GM_01320 [Nocardioidaceae bacterium]